MIRSLFEFAVEQVEDKMQSTSVWRNDGWVGERRALTGRVVEDAELEHGHENPPHRVVDLGLHERPGRQHGLQLRLVHESGARHLLVQALVDGGRVGRTPVGHDLVCGTGECLER